MMIVDKIVNQLMSNNALNPFSDTYSVEKIVVLLKSLTDEDQDININNIGTIESTIYLNSFFNMLMAETQDSIYKSGISYDTSQRFLIASANRNNVISNYKMSIYINRVFERGEKIVFEDMAGYKILSSGKEEEIFSMGQQVIETLNHAQKLLSKSTFTPDESVKVEDAFGYYHDLLEKGNYIYILKNIYDAAVWEGGYIECNQEPLSITLKFHDRSFLYIRRVGELRLQRVISSQLKIILDNHIINSSLYASYMMKKRSKYIQVLEVISGEITVNIGKLSSTERGSFYHYLGFTASITAFYPFLQSSDIELYNLAGLTLNDLHILVSEISYVVTQAESIVVSNYPKTEQLENNLEKYVFRVEEKTLYNCLLNVTEYNLNQIEKFLGIFTLQQENACDFWRNPIIKKDGYFIFLTEPLIAQNKIYLSDYLLQKGGINMSQRGADLETYIKKEINDQLTEKSYFYKVPIQKKFRLNGKSEEIDLILITKHTVLIAEIKCISSVVDSRSFYNAQKQLKKGVKQVKRKAQFITENKNMFSNTIGDITGKDVFCVVITNLPNFTGLIQDSVPIVDRVVLDNYISMGGIEFLSGDESKTLTYYTNEEEFSKNIREYLSRPPIIWSLKDRFQYRMKRITPESFNLAVYAEVVESVGDLIE